MKDFDELRESMMNEEYEIQKLLKSCSIYNVNLLVNNWQNNMFKEMANLVNKEVTLINEYVIFTINLFRFLVKT